MKTLEKQIQESWDSTYKNYDFKQLPWETVTPDPEIVKLIEKKKVTKCKALDIGCGSGTNSIFLAENGFDVTGIDIPQSAIKIAGKRAKKAGHKIKFLVGNVYNLEFPRNGFAFILDRGCFHHIPLQYRESYIKQNHKILTNGGKYYLHAFSDRNGWHQGNLFSLEKIESYFSKYFRTLESAEIIHMQPSGEKVYLWSVFMEKI